MTSVYHCFRCGEQIDPLAPSTGRRVAGWEFKAVDPARRGGSDIKLREQLPGYLHLSCADKMRNGDGQGSLL